MKFVASKSLTGESLETVAEELKGRNRRYIDCPISELFVDEETGQVEHSYVHYGLTNFAGQALGKHLGIPGGFVVKAPTDIMARNMNYFLKNAQGYVRLGIEGVNTIAGVMSTNVNPVPLERLIDRVANRKDQLDLERWYLDDHGLTMRFTSPKLTVEPRVGDIVKVGVDLHDYENTGLMDVMGSVYRLSCTNGQCIPTLGFASHLRKESWRETDQLIDLAHQYFLEAMDGAMDFATALPTLTAYPLNIPDDLEEAHEILKGGAMKVIGVPTKFTESLINSFRSEEPSLFGFYNANTRLGRDAQERSVRQRFEKAGYLTVVKREELAEAFKG